jgi:hypothetical protein
MKSLPINYDFQGGVEVGIDIGAYETKCFYITSDTNELHTDGYVMFDLVKFPYQFGDYDDIQIIDTQQLAPDTIKYTVYNPNPISFTNVAVWFWTPYSFDATIKYNDDWIPYMYCSYIRPDLAQKIKTLITYNKSMSMDISYSINSIDQCNTNSLKDLGLKPFDIVAVLWGNNIIFIGYIIDNRLDNSFGNQNYEYTINSPLWILGQKQTTAKTSFLQLYAKECADLCRLELDYRLNNNPLINVEEGTYFDALKKVLIYTKNYNVRFYVDYENAKLVFTDDTEFINTKGSEIKPINYSYEWDTDITNTVQW